MPPIDLWYNFIKSSLPISTRCLFVLSHRFTCLGMPEVIKFDSIFIGLLSYHFSKSIPNCDNISNENLHVQTTFNVHYNGQPNQMCFINTKNDKI